MIVNKANLERTNEDLKRLKAKSISLKNKLRDGLINRENYNRSKAQIDSGIKKARSNYAKLQSGLKRAKYADIQRRKRKKNPKKKLYGFMDLF